MTTVSNINRITGIASGLDTETWVKDLMAAQRVPLDKVEQQRQILQWKKEEFRSINTTLLSLRNTVFDMKLQGTYLGKKVSSTNESIVSASAGPAAANTSYTVLVNQLATVASNISTDAIASDTFDPDATLASQQAAFGDSWPADLSFTINGKSFTVDPDTDSLNDVIARVNADKEAGVSMLYDANTRKIAVTTTNTGNNNTSGAEITVTGSFMTDMLKINEVNETGGENAIVTLNGLLTERSSNTFQVNGVTFTLKSESTATQTITIANDIDGAVSAVKNFIEKYNAAIETIGTKVREKRARDSDKNYYLPLTEAQKDEMETDEITSWTTQAKTGMLYNDKILTGLLNDMRSALSSIVSGVTGTIPVTVNGVTKEVTVNSASVIGITTGGYEENGKLYLNETKLRSALEANPEAVMKLFTNNSDANDNQDGLAVRMYDAVNSAMSKITTEAGSSADYVDDSNIGDRIKELNERADVLEDRLEMIEARYWTQFNAMEVFINQMNSQSSYLAGMFNNNSSS